MQTTDITHIAHLAEICFRRGIRNVVLSPGSRNAPLIIAFDEHPGIRTYLIHDERSAAFFAIGLAEALGEPVAIACTSGSAPLNYAPAIAEAYYRQVPLLVLTADRPVAWIDHGDGQTIRQKNVFHNYIKAEFELPDFSTGGTLNGSDEIVHRAIDQLMLIPTAPVHINIPLSEPLYGTAELRTSPADHEFSPPVAGLSGPEKEEIEKSWRAAGRKLVLVGQMEHSLRMAELLQPLLNDPSVAILVENTSNLQNFQKIVHCIDRTLAVIGPDEAEAFRPDLLLTLGGAVISKKIKTFLRNHKPVVNWRVGQYLFEEDTYCSLTRSFACHPAVFLEFIGNIGPGSTGYGSQWKNRDFRAQQQHRNFLETIPFSDLRVFHHVLDTLPEGSFLHMGNSSVVRYCQLFDPVMSIRYFCNRGVSGIDGSTSTAAGIAVARKEKLNVLISGDVSFLYDSNALWNNYLSENFRVIVINNGGGGIFQILEGPGSVRQAPYFFSPYRADIRAVCQAFDITYHEASDEEQLLEGLAKLYSVVPGSRPALLEVKTFSAANPAILKSYFEALGKGE